MYDKKNRKDKNLYLELTLYALFYKTFYKIIYRLLEEVFWHSYFQEKTYRSYRT